MNITHDQISPHPSKSMHIAVLGTRGIPNIQGGVETHCEHIYPELVKHGCEVTVFRRTPYVSSSSKLPTPNSQLSFNGVNLIDIYCPRIKSLEAIVHTFLGVFAAWKLRPDILHIHAVGPSLMVPLARLLGMKVVITHHGPDYEREKWQGIAKIVLMIGEWLGCKCAHRVITISQPIAKHIKKKTGREALVIPNGVVIPEPAKSDEMLKRFGIEKGKYILAVGRFVPEKGFHDLIEAYNKLGVKRVEFGEKQSTPNCALPTPSSKLPTLDSKLVIVGDADHEDAYSRSVKELARKNPHVVLTGFLKGEPLKELYSHAGLFVLPSYYEGLPIVLLEALSYGLSCVVSDIPANRNVPLPNERFIPAGNVDAWAHALDTYISKQLSDEEKRTQIEMIRRTYNWPSIAEQTFQVYSKTML